MVEQVAPDARLVRVAAEERVAQLTRRARHARHAQVAPHGRDPGPPAVEAPAVPLPTTPGPVARDQGAHVAPQARVAQVAAREERPAASPWVVAVVNLKGGSGKTTTSMHLAAAWHAAGEKVVVIDADPQGSAVAWASDCAEADDPLPWPVWGRATATLHREIGTLVAGSEIALIDCPPAAADHRVVRSAIRAADCVLVPCRPTAPDSRRVAPTRELVVELATEHELDLVLAVVLTQTRAGTISRTAFREALDASDVAVLDAEIPMREVFSWAEGGGVQPEAVAHYQAVAAELDILRGA